MYEFHLVALNGSPSSTSRTHAIAQQAVDLAGNGEIIELGALDADALLGRKSSPDVTSALETIERSTALLFATPIYRATFSGLLKVLADLLPPRSLSGKSCILAATGGSPQHSLAIDTGLRPLIASLDGWSVPTSIYLTHEDFDDEGRLVEIKTLLLEQAIAEAKSIPGVVRV